MKNLHYQGPPSPSLSQGASSLSCAADHIAWTHIGLCQKELKHVAGLYINERTLQTGAQAEIIVWVGAEKITWPYAVFPHGIRLYLWG